MLPTVVLHNSISLDGSLTDFEVNMELHYQIAGKYNSDARLIGSNTIKTGIALYGESPVENNDDFIKPKRDQNLPYWVIIDTKGSLKDKLHEVRRFEFCKDVIILISEQTKDDYIEYLQKRDYDYHIIGKEKVDLRKALEFIYNNYRVKSILTDTGRILGNLLINKRLVNEISLLVHPVIVGKKSYGIFNDIDKNINLKLVKSQEFDGGYLWLVYQFK
jgi:2,5-diamino-6-(ribosylamino)-4(3H)-pyrimidinone 5'-phosphate reductase